MNYTYLYVFHAEINDARNAQKNRKILLLIEKERMNLTIFYGI